MAASGARKVAVVTGGSAGVGRATVREFAQHGYDVAVLARGQAGIDGAVADVLQAGREAIGVLGRRGGPRCHGGCGRARRDRAWRDRCVGERMRLSAP